MQQARVCGNGPTKLAYNGIVVRRCFVSSRFLRRLLDEGVATQRCVFGPQAPTLSLCTKGGGVGCGFLFFAHILLMDPDVVLGLLLGMHGVD